MRIQPAIQFTRTVEGRHYHIGVEVEASIDSCPRSETEPAHKEVHLRDLTVCFIESGEEMWENGELPECITLPMLTGWIEDELYERGIDD